MRTDPTFGAPPAGQAAEQVFLDLGTIKVTNTRFIVPGQTYAMSGITSVSHIEKDPSKALGWTLIIIGALICVTPLLPMGILFILGGALYLWKGKGKYDVQLQTSSGALRALTSKDKDMVQRVANALNSAIIYRG
jgi:hypothetical protein